VSVPEPPSIASSWGANWEEGLVSNTVKVAKSMSHWADNSHGREVPYAHWRSIRKIPKIEFMQKAQEVLLGFEPRLPEIFFNSISQNLRKSKSGVVTP
jgi:hypothetical protein